MIILVASYCHNTTVIHEDFKKFLKIEKNNNSNMQVHKKSTFFGGYWSIIIHFLWICLEKDGWNPLSGATILQKNWQFI